MDTQNQMCLQLYVWMTHLLRCLPRTLTRHSCWRGGTRWTSWWTFYCLCLLPQIVQSSHCVCSQSSLSDACKAGSVETERHQSKYKKKSNHLWQDRKLRETGTKFISESCEPLWNDINCKTRFSANVSIPISIDCG